jgi:lysophospholipase L1-like esterase
VLVVATPIPFELLEPLGLYDSARFDQRIAVLSEVVERAGGRLIDLHDLLGKHEFRDDAGHFSAQGTRRIADAVLPEIKKELAVLGLTQ